jgi:hypothetical protein
MKYGIVNGVILSKKVIRRSPKLSGFNLKQKMPQNGAHNNGLGWLNGIDHLEDKR